MVKKIRDPRLWGRQGIELGEFKNRCNDLLIARDRIKEMYPIMEQILQDKDWNKFKDAIDALDGVSEWLEDLLDD